MSTPVYRVTANSADITAAVLDRLVSLSITDEAGLESDTLEITLSDHDPAAPLQTPPTGAEIEVWLGYGVAAQRMGMWVVDEVEFEGWPSAMTIRARGAAYETSKGGKKDLQTQKSRSWPKSTKLGDMVAKIAKEHGMEPAVGKSLKSIVLPHYDQTEESDLSFLIRVAKRYDALVKPAGGKLVVAKRGESKTTSGEALAPVMLLAGDCTSYRLTLSRKESPGTVVAFWHNKKTARRVEVKVGSGEPVKQLRHSHPDAGAAKAAAQAELDRRKRGEERLSVSMPGNPLLMAESPLTLVGFRTDVDGQWLTTRVTHSIDPSGGYRCDVDAEKPNASE